MENDINVTTINVDLDELAKNFDIWFEKTVKGKSENDIYNLMKIFYSFCGEPLNTEKPLSEKKNLISFKKYVRVSNERK